MKIIITALIVCLCALSPSTQASWLKDALNKSKEAIGGWITPDEEQLPDLTFKELQDYPSQYLSKREIEPLYKSPLFYLEAGSKANPPVLLIHGLGDAASKDWLKVIPELEKDYHVFAIDLPGFGLSKGRYFEYSPENYSQIIQWFITSKIRSKPILIGHSMGGAISLYYAAAYPENISQLVLIDAAGILERTSYIKHLAELPDLSSNGPKIWSQLDSNIRNFSNKWVEKSGEFYDPTKILQNNKLLRQFLMTEQGGLNAALAMIDTDYSQIDFKKVPTTVMIWGQKDVIAPLRTGRALLAKIPKAKLRTIPDAGHVPMNSHPRQFNSILLEEIKVNILELTNPQDSEVTKSDELANEASNRKTSCENDNNPVFTGEYHTITLNNCKLAVLADVKVMNFSSNDSIVTVSDSQLGNLHSIIEINSSAVTATASKFYGTINTNRSRLDFAGVSLYSDERIMTATDTTKLVFSISEAVSNNYNGPLHGYFPLSEGSLDQYLVDKN